MSDSRPSPLLRILSFVLVTGGVVGMGWWLYEKQKTPAIAKAAAVKGAASVLVTKVKRENYAFDLETVGTVKAFESIDLMPNVTETVTALNFEDGQFVKKGDLLATLSDSEEQAMLASAKATLTEHERDIARLQALVKDGAAPEAKLEESRTLGDIAKQKICETEAKMADRRIVAPFDGWLGLRRISVGALVSPTTVLTTLDKVDVVKIDFNVPETAIGSLKPGNEIGAFAEGAKDRTFKGKLASLDSRIDPITRSVAARAEVPNPDRALRAGMLLIVKVAIEPRISLSVPERALVPVGAKKYVFTVDDGKARRVEVHTDRRKPGYVEITGGVEEGQLVVTDGIVGLQDGNAVSVAGDFKGPVAAFNPESVK